MHIADTAEQDTIVAAGRRTTMADLITLICAEYREMPGLCLTRPQLQRFWNLDAITRDAALEFLETAGFLRRMRNGAYVRADA